MTSRKITEKIVIIGFFSCIFAAIWAEDPLKFILSGVYLLVVGKYFGITYRKEPVLGETIHRQEEITSYLGMKLK